MIKWIDMGTPVCNDIHTWGGIAETGNTYIISCQDGTDEYICSFKSHGDQDKPFAVRATELGAYLSLEEAKKGCEAYDDG